MVLLIHARLLGRAKVRRLITLVDVLYERSVKLVCLAEAPADMLFDPGPGRRADMPDEVFSFARTVSRLTEMQGEDYLKRQGQVVVLVLPHNGGLETNRPLHIAL